MKGKLCFVATIGSTLESFVIPVAYRFKEKGYDVTLCCTMTEEFINRYRDDFHCINIQMQRGINIKDLITKPLEFYKILKREKFDYIQYATTNASVYAGIPAKILGIKTRVYCSWGLLYVGYQGFKRSIFRKIEQLMCSTATHITVASYWNMEVAVNDGVMSRHKCSVIGCGGTVGVDLEQFDFKRRSEFREKVLQEYPELSGKTIFGYVGRIETDKGINELLKAFRKVNNPNYALLMIGAFDKLRCNLDTELLDWAVNCNNIIFHGFTREVPKYMSAIDILVHPTYREGFSMVIQQAMAMGCAIITTNIPGPSEVIEENISGLLVSSHNADELAEAMENLGKDQHLQMLFSDAALKRVIEFFERKKMLDLNILNREQMMSGKI